MKGQVSYPFSMFEAAVTFLLLISVVYGAQAYTESFMKTEAADAQADRVKNAAMALDSFPIGHIDLPISDYQYKIEGDELTLEFRDANETVNIGDSLTVNSINGSNELTSVSGLCLEKKTVDSETIMDFTSGGC